MDHNYINHCGYIANLYIPIIILEKILRLQLRSHRDKKNLNIVVAVAIAYRNLKPQT
jgi:hypothetical protein